MSMSLSELSREVRRAREEFFATDSERDNRKWIKLSAQELSRAKTSREVAKAAHQMPYELCNVAQARLHRSGQSAWRFSRLPPWRSR